MKIEVGVQEQEDLFAEIKRVSDSVNRSIPGMAKYLEVKEGMSGLGALTVLSQQLAEIIISHANLEVAMARLENHCLKTEATLKVLEDEYNDLGKAYTANTDLLDGLILRLSAPPEDEYQDLLNSALDNVVEYSYDTGNAGLSTTYTFKEGDLKRALSDAIHGYNIKVLNS